MIQIYTAGYSGHRVEELKARVEELDALVFDIRLKPASMRPEWRQGAMVKLLGERHVWLPHWGNLNYQTEFGIKLSDFHTGLTEFNETMRESGKQTAILLCCCARFQTCHRFRVAVELDKVHRREPFLKDWVEELDWNPVLVTA